MSEFVTFRVGEQLCAVEAAQVQHIFRPRGLTDVPLAAPEIRGVMSLRGRIVTAVCARTRLGLEPSPDFVAIGLEHHGDSYGLLVDSVGEVLSLDPTELAAPPGALPSRWADSVRAVCQLDQELLLVLDAPSLLEPRAVEVEC
jgi:purine-binding chemotaxis protein CheW